MSPAALVSGKDYAAYPSTDSVTIVEKPNHRRLNTLSRDVAANEAARHILAYGMSLDNARTKPADFFSILSSSREFEPSS
jgi:hypothetical protein